MKEELKRKKNLRLLQTIDICKQHGGPLTDNNLELVESLSENNSSLKLRSCGSP